MDPAEIRQVPKRAEARAYLGTITGFVLAGINDLMRGGGSSAFRTSSPMQRFFRDMNFLASHALLDPEISNENYGRVLLGLEPNTPL